MAIKVTVRVFATLRNYMERETETDLPEGTKISGLLDLLTGQHSGMGAELFDALGILKPYINILKNGRNIAFLQDMDTALDDGDIVAIFPPVAGG